MVQLFVVPFGVNYFYADYNSTSDFLKMFSAYKDSMCFSIKWGINLFYFVNFEVVLVILSGVYLEGDTWID